MRPVNIWYAGNQLILADFRLFYIKSTRENSNTPFKVGVDYYQAPERFDMKSTQVSTRSRYNNGRAEVMLFVSPHLLLA